MLSSSDKVVLITDGSGGTGEEIAIELADESMKETSSAPTYADLSRRVWKMSAELLGLEEKRAGGASVGTNVIYTPPAR